MRATGGRLLHWALLTGLLLAVTLAAFIWSSHGLGYPNPRDIGRPIAQLKENSDRDRDLTLTRFLLLCLDSLTKGKTAKAVSYCNTVVTLDPQNGTALKLRGNAYLHAGRGAQAVADFTRAIRISAGDVEAYRFRANAYGLQKHDRLALADFDRAIALSPGDAFNYHTRGFFFQSRLQYTRAIADFSAAIALQPGFAAAWNSRCWARAVAGIDLAAALTDCDRSLALQPASANTWDSRGLVLLRMGRYRESVLDYGKALARNPGLATSLFGRGAAKLWINDTSAARDIAAAKAIEPGIEARFLGYGIKLRANGPPWS